MWKYVKKYIPLAILAIMLMIGEVLVDLIQPNFMSQIVDDGSHNDLIDKKGKYYELYMTQYAGFAT